MDESKALQVFNFEGHEFQVIIHNGKPAFIGNEVCAVLGYKNSRAALAKLPDHQKDDVAIRDAIGRMQNTKIVYEGGIYRLILRSHLPNAEAFTDLVTDVILPTIRQTGSYSAQQQPLQLPEKASSKQAVVVLQEMQALVEKGELGTELPYEKRDSLDYCLRKAQGYFTGHTLSITTGRKDEFGRLRLSEYPDD